MNSKARLGLEAFLIALCGLTAWFAPNAQADALIAIQKALIGFAGLVVTIFGIWIAVIFPVLSSLLSSGKTKHDVAQVARYDVLIRALYRACFTLTAAFFVFLILSFCHDYSLWVAKAGAFFSWLAFIATAWALWSAVCNGEGAVAGGINDSLRVGVARRFRTMGRFVGRKKEG